MLYGKKKKNEEIWDNFYYQEKKFLLYPDEEVVRYFSSKNPGEVLDIGCGGGRHLKYFQEKGFFAVGIDTSQEALKKASSYAPVIQASVVNLPFPKESFSYALMWGVLHYIPKEQWKKALEEIQRILKKGGVLLTSIRCYQDTHLKKQQALEGISFHLFRKKEIIKLFSLYFSSLQIGERMRIPIGKKEKIAHYIVEAIR